MSRRHTVPGAVLQLYPVLMVLLVLAFVLAIPVLVAVDPPWWVRVPVWLVVGGLATWTVEAVREMREPVDEDDGLADAGRDTAPRLWALVDDVAAAVGSPTVDRLQLAPVPNAGVRVDDDGARRLVLGVPLLAALTHGSLRALVAHELGHLAHDAAEPRWYRRAHERALRAESTAGPVRWIALVVLWLHDLADGRAARAAELRADEWTLRVAAREDAVAALRRSARANAAWDHWGDLVVTPAWAGRVRTPLTGAFADFLSEHHPDVDRAAQAEMDEPAPRASSHPAPSARVEALRALPDPASPVPPDPRPALDLLDPDVLLDLEARMLALGDLPVVGRDEAVATNGGAALVENAQGVVRLDLDGGRRDYAALVEAAARGDGFGLVETPVMLLSPSEIARWDAAVAAGEDPGEALDPDPDVDAVAQAVGACLVETAGARVVLAWPNHALTVGGETVELHAPLRAAPDPAGMARAARDLVAAHGGDLTVVPGSRLALPDVVLGVAAGSTGPWTGRRDLLVLRTGLLALPGPTKRRRSVGGETRRLERLALTDPAVLRAGADAWWLPVADVVSARLPGPRGRLRLTLRDGRQVELRPAPKDALDTEGFAPALARVLPTERPDAGGS